MVVWMGLRTFCSKGSEIQGYNPHDQERKDHRNGWGMHYVMLMAKLESGHAVTHLRILAYSTRHTVVQAHAGFFKRTTRFNVHYFYSTLHNTDHFNAALKKRPDSKIQHNQAHLSIIKRIQNYPYIHIFNIQISALPIYDIIWWISKEHHPTCIILSLIMHI